MIWVTLPPPPPLLPQRLSIKGPVMLLEVAR